MHDARHTYAVNALRAGYRPEVVAHQLGHRDTTLVWKVYGRYIPKAEDYGQNATPRATPRRVKHHAR
jgi:integrase